ncbi:MAG: DNA polymerase I [uncultured Thermomicrobiales bacterium]|uniref:DNA polymerase I n=1 Tax=uncultured Thermomicrobiales bacterium TaxID=1645740 RepID=A0A6J4UYB0_9BACT|nr:MAG: DNA polymerase I [uncultured Thermomicrobiales bacterium]
MTDRSATDARRTLMLVDGFGLIFRAYHALPTSLATASGEQTNAVFGFASMLLDVLRGQRPDYAIVALEGGRTFRHDEFDAYKANRGDAPDDLKAQIARVYELIDALGIHRERREGYEADDVIGSLADSCAAAGMDVVIVTGDSDLLQLAADRVRVVLPGVKRFGDVRVFDTAAVVDRYGFGPEFVPDYKALVGDSSDNIPGVPGIGDKTAKALIGQFGGIEAILDHLDEIKPPRARAALEANADQARASKRLASIVRDLDIPFDPAQGVVGGYDRERVLALFRELEFRNLMNKLPEPVQAASSVASEPRPERPPSERTIVKTEEQLDALVARVREVGRVAVDVETTATDPLTAELVGIALAVSASEGAYVPLGHPDGDQLPLDRVRDAIAPLLTDPAVAVSAHHGKYDLAVLQRHGFDATRLDFDTMIAAFLLNETSIGLKNLAFNRLGIEMTEITDLIGTGKAQLTMDKIAADTAGDYACGDVEATFALQTLYAPQIEEQELGPLLRDIELPLVPVLIGMERTGIAIDVPYLRDLSAEITARFGELEREIHALAGRELNIGSTRQIAALLFEELGLPSGRRTKTGYSVDSDALEAIRGKHPIVDLILEHRSLAKLRSTYVDALPQAVNPRTGRVHTSYNQTIAATGRLSSINPNLQNIPVRTELGRRVRRAFVADTRPDHRLFDDAVLLSADYSQIELRLLADMSGEPFLVEAFRNGEDIHAATAAAVHDVAPADVTPDQRRIAKTVNFGVMYGMQSYGLSRDSGLSRAESQAFIDQYWARLPRVRAMFDETLRFGVAQGYVRTPSGRRRYLPDLTSSNGQRRVPAERMAINMPVQGAAADIIKVAMIRLDAVLRERDLPARILLQVHDELVLEVDRTRLPEVAEVVKTTMEHAWALSVPLEVEVRTGPNWDGLAPFATAVDAAVAR